MVSVQEQLRNALKLIDADTALIERQSKRIKMLEAALSEIAASEWYGPDHVDEVARDMRRIALQAVSVAAPQGEGK